MPAASTGPLLLENTQVKIVNKSLATSVYPTVQSFVENNSQVVRGMHSTAG